MRTEFIVIKQIKTPVKLTRKLYLYDFAFILIYVAFAEQLSVMVHEWLYYPYMASSILWACFLTKKSSFNLEKRNWQTLVYYLLRRKVYFRSESKIKPTPKGESTL